MISNNKILAIIPARGNSKILKKKNILPLNGRPLIEYTIENALKSKYIDKIVCSSEDHEILKFCEKFSQVFALKRPMYLSADEVSCNDVVKHILLEMIPIGWKSDDIVILLQPTSPFRTFEDIDYTIKFFSDNLHICKSVISVRPVNENPNWMVAIDKSGFLCRIANDDLQYIRQNLTKLYIFNGAIYITKIATFIENSSFFTDKTIPYIMPFEKSIDIDDEFDLRLAEFLLKNTIENK